MHAETILSAPLGLTLDWDASGRLSSVQLHWSNDNDLNHETPDLSAFARQVKQTLEEYAAGKVVVWPELPSGSFEAAGLSDFAMNVLETLRRHCATGKVLTYGELAGLADSAGAARAVGRVMASNPWPLLYPCHRVIGSDGRLTGFSGAGLPMKAWLLRLEGIVCDEQRLKSRQPPRKIHLPT